MRIRRVGAVAAAGAAGMTMILSAALSPAAHATSAGSILQEAVGLFGSSGTGSLGDPTPPDVEPGGVAGGFTSKTPYAPGQRAEDLQQVPDGYAPVYTESVARHGSRALSSLKYDDLTLQLWELAEAERALTPLGAKLGPAVRDLMAANREVGYGNLSGLGVTEHRRMGARVAERVPSLFDSIARDGGSITVTSSGVDRAVDSAVNFAEGLVAVRPDVADTVAPVGVDVALLYFHDSDTAYLDYEENDPRLHAAVQQIHDLPRTREVARHMMLALYTESFVNRLAAGEFSLVDRGKGKERVENEVDAADMLYNTYIITPGMAQEGDWDFARFISEDDLQWMAYLNDAEDFYAKGPGFSGENVTYEMATVLRDEFLRGLAAHTTVGASAGADFRFAHAETVIPFAALLELPGSTEQQPTDTLYTYANNPWRGALVSPMAANIQWDVFTDAAGKSIVRMLYNERETAFAAPCTPMTAGSFFYDAAELQRCVPLISLVG
ncbi:histidine-type phosphatase [Rhodococcus sp. SGAir0479]|uniref:histidine-type phosphatase n=1 Tax=Rhodococcus sp. SGAir0479 TaxID=2567884 RepID=UPI0010CCEDC1|nr:histidine-type phosphatase [Rhodococcus sp. SGAir0479]QCQ92767.1 histidine-type phosphatase [Rhodococcus sp. SGAir0479]